MRYVTSKQMKLIDKTTIEKFGIAGIVLMENAGRGAAVAVVDMIKEKPTKGVICVCGKGNNAGDGFVCARHLVNKGLNVQVFVMAKGSELKGSAKANFDILNKMGVGIKELSSERAFYSFEEKLKENYLIVDAIFGIGLSGEVREPYKKVISLINRSESPVLSIDVPSGLNADTGVILGEAVEAEKTVTFGLPKAGFIQENGPDLVGELVVVDISIPYQILTDGGDVFLK